LKRRATNNLHQAQTLLDHSRTVPQGGGRAERPTKKSAARRGAGVKEARVGLSRLLSRLVPAGARSIRQPRLWYGTRSHAHGALDALMLFHAQTRQGADGVSAPTRRAWERDEWGLVTTHQQAAPGDHLTNARLAAWFGTGRYTRDERRPRW
jgi:hypothetical protein